jgi:site-specific DNA-methyltransferase (adenine-specific)
VAIEDAGFEVRDCLMWLYGSGFPKSLDVSKAMDKQAGAEREVVGTWKPTGSAAVKIKGGGHANAGVRGEVEEIRQSIAITAPNTDLAKEWHGWGTALKPAYEPAILARKPLRGTVADNVAQWGTGGLNIDGCRVGSEGATRSHQAPISESGWRTGHKILDLPSGRWPANVILDEEAAATLDAQSGERHGGAHVRNNTRSIFNAVKNNTSTGHSDTGGASRFFYTAKASRSEREAGLDGVEAKQAGSMRGHTDYKPRLSGDGKPITEPHRANHHPTVKPIALMRYMIRLVVPRGAVVLDPFMGSGSTGCAAMVEGMQFVGIDITPEYVDIARRRLAWWSCSLDGNAIIKTEEDDT